MRPNVDFQKKAKNSFIYFQVGLIATMLIVLFVLEFNFKDSAKFVSPPFTTEPIQEPIFVYNPAPATKPQVLNKPVATKITKVVHVFKPTKEEPVKEDPKTSVETQDNTNNTTTVETTSTSNEGKVDKPIEGPTDYSPFSVEQLPMFPACKGLSRAEQKACFDEQLARVIVKHLVYPEDDLEDGKQGVAQVEFIIDENGVITNVVALNNKRATSEMQKAAEKAVKRIPKLIPAKQGSKSVRIKYSIPVVFKIR
ncbi:energy transducer TonB [Flavobacterium sp.]|uniref:energy transducer TonB n=2 Tax=Flavobacterium sp. TaxID=239 RepID=UPI0040475CDF